MTERAMLWFLFWGCFLLPGGEEGTVSRVRETLRGSLLGGVWMGHRAEVPVDFIRKTSPKWKKERKRRDGPQSQTSSKGQF